MKGPGKPTSAKASAGFQEIRSGKSVITHGLACLQHLYGGLQGDCWKPLAKCLLKLTACPPLLPEHQWPLCLFCLLKYKFVSSPQSNPKPFWGDGWGCSFQAFTMKGEVRCLSHQQCGIPSKETRSKMRSFLMSAEFLKDVYKRWKECYV